MNEKYERLNEFLRKNAATPCARYLVVRLMGILIPFFLTLILALPHPILSVFLCVCCAGVLAAFLLLYHRSKNDASSRLLPDVVAWTFSSFMLCLSSYFFVVMVLNEYVPWKWLLFFSAVWLINYFLTLFLCKRCFLKEKASKAGGALTPWTAALLGGVASGFIVRPLFSNVSQNIALGIVGMCVMLLSLVLGYVGGMFLSAFFVVKKVKPNDTAQN